MDIGSIAYWIRAREGGVNDFPLIVAAQEGHRLIATIVLENGADINVRGDNANPTALYAAAAFGHGEVVSLLLEKGADPNAEVGDFGTALRAAAHGGHADFMERLMPSGAKLIVEDPSGQSPGVSTFHLAAQSGHEDAVKLLVRRDSGNVNSTTQEGLSPPMQALSGAHTAVAQLLLQNGANPNAKDQSGITALMKAV